MSKTKENYNDGCFGDREEMIARYCKLKDELNKIVRASGGDQDLDALTAVEELREDHDKYEYWYFQKCAELTAMTERAEKAEAQSDARLLSVGEIAVDLSNALDSLTIAEKQRDAAVAGKDQAYEERNRLVALLASIYPSGVKQTDIPGWDAEWHGCVFIDFPWGQASWHYHDSQSFLFDHLPPYQGEWDGHTTEGKYQAIHANTLVGELEDNND